jgi:hypothetical protein
LNATDSWATLTDNLPADSSTNITVYVDTNLVQFGSGGSGGSGGGGGGGGIPTPGGSGGGGGSGGTNGTPGTGFYRVVRDGAHLFGLTNGTVLSGVVNLPIELANAGGTVSTVSITENETPIGNSTQVAPTINPLLTMLDTTLLTNGVHMISASARWDDANGGLWEAESPAISVTVSNEISFENWMPTFGEIGNTFLFRAASTHTNTDWVVSVYGDNTYLGYFSGHTYDGDISFYYDYSGTSLTNISVFSFEIATEYVDPLTPKTYKQTDPWPYAGGWVMGVQHAFDSLIDHELLYEELNGFLGAAQSQFYVYPSPVSGNPFAVNFQNSSEVANWATFRQALYSPYSRNICYFGHGGPTGIGYNSHDTNVYIPSKEIASVLHTIPAGQTNRHVFRFVFLDGCSTAKGDLPESFGILHKQNVQTLDYYNASMRPSVFCGWSADKAVGFIMGSSINYDHVNFISHIQEDMLLRGDTIGKAVAYAASQPDVTSVFTSEFILFGCPDVTFGSNNN